MKRLLRIPFYIPIVPILIIYFLLKAIWIISETILEVIEDFIELYARFCRNLVPGLKIDH